MPLDHGEQLKSIRKFPSLIKYLREEMDWPLDSDSFEDISFEFTPEEIEAIFDLGDVDGDGTIDMDEFVGKILFFQLI